MSAAAAALAVLLSAGAPPVSAAAPAREALDRARDELHGLEALELLGRETGAAGCAGLTVDALMESAKKENALTTGLSPVQDQVVQLAFRYYTCRAFAEKSAAVCGRLTPFDGFARPNPRLECARYSGELFFAHATMTDAPDLLDRCRANLTHPEDNEFRAEDTEKVCAIVMRLRHEPNAVCSELEPLFLKKRQLEKCRAWFGGLNGEAAGCRELSDNDVKERCLAYAAFRRARRAGDAAACGGEKHSALCRLFMGGGVASCADYERRIRAGVCRRLGELCGKYGPSGASALERAEAAVKSSGASGEDRLRLEQELEGVRALKRRRDGQCRALAKGGAT
jgi:hypothetical protein